MEVTGIRTISCSIRTRTGSRAWAGASVQRLPGVLVCCVRATIAAAVTPETNANPRKVIQVLESEDRATTN